MGLCHYKKLLFVALAFLIGTLFGCTATKDQSASTNRNSIGVSQAEPTTEKEKEETLTNAEVYALFTILRDTYKDDRSSSDYTYELDDFEDRYGSSWNASGLISIERGYGYYFQALEYPESPVHAAILFDQSASEFRDGINAMAASNLEGKAYYSEYGKYIDNLYFCESRYYYVSNKIQSVVNDDQLPRFVKQFRDFFYDLNCPSQIRAWAVADSIFFYTDRESLKNRMSDAYQYLEKTTDTEEVIYITSSLARAEYNLGNFVKSIALFDRHDDTKITEYAKYIYNAEGMISSKRRYRKAAIDGLAIQMCREYWNTPKSSKRDEKRLIEIVNSYNELHDLVKKGIKETKPVYETLSYSNEQIVVGYNVSPLLFKVQSSAERLANKIDKAKSVNYPVFFANMLESVSFLQKSVDLIIKGYYLKKKDYRGEWEKAEAYMDESRGLYSLALENGVEKFSGRKFSQCIIDDWNKYIKYVSDMSM